MWVRYHLNNGILLFYCAYHQIKWGMYHLWSFTVRSYEKFSNYLHQIAFFYSFLNVFDVMRVLRLLTLSRLLALGITGASCLRSALAVAALQCCSSQDSLRSYERQSRNPNRFYDSQKLTLYLYINIEVFLGYGNTL